MATDESLDKLRRQALDNFEFWDKVTKFFLVVAAVAELVLGVALIWLTDFSDPIQRLIFLAVATIYLPLGFFMFAISCHAERNFERILHAIELQQDSSTEDKE